MMEPIAGAWFDGRSSRARPVKVRLLPVRGGPSLEIEPLDAGDAPPLLRRDQVGWPENWSSRRAPAKLVVDLRSHGSLELADVEAWNAALAAAGHKAPLAQRMQTRWSAFLLVALLAAAGLAAFYRWGTPW